MKTSAVTRLLLRFLLSAALIPWISYGCLWDRDTILIEAKGRMEVIETIIGWYDRFPPLYYEMRLDRVTKENLERPDNLELYDDAAVAADRLGRPEEAIQWMEKKKARMEALGTATNGEHAYRTLANIGTFYAHHWIKNRAKESTFVELDRAIRCIEEALVINPGAHFGRERVQLILLKWLRNPIHAGTRPKDPTDAFESSLGQVAGYFAAEGDLDIVKGLCGIIQIGAAQDSLDVHVVLGAALDSRSRFVTLHHLTLLRVAEMVVCAERTFLNAHMNYLNDSWQSIRGSGNLGNQDQQITELASLIRPSFGGWLATKNLKPLAPWFFSAREAAADRRHAMDAFMLTKFNKGQHPDTHPDFWNGWVEPVIPALPPLSVWEKLFGAEIGSRLDPDSNGVAKLVYLVIAGVLAYALLRWLYLKSVSSRRSKA